MNFLQRARQSVNTLGKSFGNSLKTMLFPSSSSWSSSWGNSLSGLLSFSADDYDFRERAGKLHHNSSVLACLKALLRMLTDAEPMIEKRGPKSQGWRWEADHEHPLLDLLQNPNPYFDATQLLDAITISYVLDGNAYLWKCRARSGQVVQLWYVPHTLIEPIRLPDANAFISHYRYTVNGKHYELPVADIVHIKNGLDPDNDLKGLSDLAAELRNICTENEAVNYTNAILYNAGVPNVVISPKEKEDTIEEPEDLENAWVDKFSGKKRGRPWVQSFPLDIQVLGFDPKQMDVSALRRIPMASVAAAIGIPAVVVGLLIGLETSTAKASYADSLRQAYIACVLPLLKRIARQLTKQLVNDPIAPWGDTKKLRIRFDTSEVQCLNEDENDKADRWAMLYEKGVCKRGEARAEMSLPVEDADNAFASELGAQQPAPDATAKAAADKAAKDQATKDKKKADANADG